MLPSVTARTPRFLLLLALLALCGALALADDGEDDSPVLEDGKELGKSQLGRLPDTSDLEEKKALKCGICQNSVLQMLYNLLKMETDEMRKLKEIEVVEILEATCATSMDGFGLLLDDAGNPTRNWSNDEVLLKAKGGWITRMAQGVCNDIYNEFEDYLVEEGPKTCKIIGEHRKCRTAKVVRTICEDGFKWCPKGQVPDDSEKALDGEAAAPADAKKEL